jgi:alpha-glucosidase
MNKLDYLQELGVEAIYFNPIFVSPSTHKYDIQDYNYIDPHFGVIVKDGGRVLDDDENNNSNATKYMIRTTDAANLEASNAFFAKLVKAAHDRGIKVILDGVFNHCGAFNRWLDREGFYHKNGYPVGAYESEDSEYHSFFKWYDGQWPYNGNYDGWWGHTNHPKLNYEESEVLYNYILDIGRMWVSPPYNCDGWRLDVAADLGFSKEFNMKFWRDFRSAVKSANPEAIILAEHYGDAGDWLGGDQWDTVMNYDAFMEPITWFLTGMEKHSEQADGSRFNDARSFESAMRYYTSRFSMQSLSVAMNELSNHDHSRFLTRTNRTVGRLHTVGADAADRNLNYGIMKEAITYQMTWVGAPTIYYGDEAGLTGWTDPDNRRPFPWGRENKDIFSFYKKMIELHKSRRAFSYGSLSYLYMNYGVVCYGRWDKDDKIAVVLNNNFTEQTVNIPIWRIGCEDGDSFVRLVCSYEDGWDDAEEVYVMSAGSIDVRIPPFGSVVVAKQ